MFSYLKIDFPTLATPLIRAAELNHSHARYEHEIANIYFADWEVPYASVSSGTPVSVQLNGLTSSRTMHGYVHHVKPDISPNKNYVELSIIGASYVLKQESQQVWADVTADQVVADIARKNGFSYIAEPHPRVYDQISQSGLSDWELLVKLAKQCGYSFHADGTTLIFQPLTQNFTDFRQQASYYALGTLEGKTTGIYSFKPLIGEAIPFHDAKKSAATIGGVDRVSSVKHVNTNQKSIKKTRKKYVSPSFDSYHTRVVAPSFEIAKYESDAADELNRYAYRGTVVIPGNSKLLPGDPIYLDNIGETYSGYWTVLKVEHFVKREVFTSSILVGTDSLGLSVQWSDNKNIERPDAAIKRLIRPGVRQKNVIPKTVLKKKGPHIKTGNGSHFSTVKNKPGVTSQSSATYKWAGTSGNLKQSTFNDKKMGPAVLAKMVNNRGR